MKKAFALMVVLVMAAGTCFAAGSSGTSGSIDFTKTGGVLTGDPTTAAADTALIGKTSTGVDVAWQTSTEAYSLMTQHQSGTRAFGSSYDSTAIYQTTATNIDPGTPAYNDGDLTASDTTDFAGTDWKAM